VPRRRTTADRDRDIRAVELARRGLTYDQIAAQMDYRDRSGAFRAVQRGLADAYRETADALTRLEMERLAALTRLFEKIIATRHYAVSLGAGRVVMDPRNPEQPLIDDGPALAAGLALLRVSESRRKLKGLDAPSRRQLEVITADTVEANISRLEAELAASDPADTGTR
jgi:hypothetical protein